VGARERFRVDPFAGVPGRTPDLGVGVESMEAASSFLGGPSPTVLGRNKPTERPEGFSVQKSSWAGP
jgi:hypothetical protein